MINYTLTRSIEEVYTAFYSYVANSSIDINSKQVIDAINQNNGNPTSQVNIEKRKKYGYKILSTNFVGFSNCESDVVDKFTALNKKLSDFYSRLDEMYDATITVVNEIGKSSEEKPRCGDRVNFIGGQFYVTAEEHSWSYNQSSKITYHCERGGIYNEKLTWDSGFFRQLSGITKTLREIEY